MFMWTAIRLAGKNAQLKRELRQRDEQIDGLTARIRRMTSDIDLVTACLPAADRKIALQLVRDLHRIENLDEVEQ
jgi:hypothetical protein